jgi:hypothetical protein
VWSEAIPINFSVEADGYRFAPPILRAEQRQFPAMKKISPAFRIPITHSELATLGELCAIQGQVEHLLIHTLHYVLDVKLDAARAVLGHTSIHTNAHTWIAIFREKCGDREVIKMADEAFSLVAGITRGRNDSCAFRHSAWRRVAASSLSQREAASAGKGQFSYCDPYTRFQNSAANFGPIKSQK